MWQKKIRSYLNGVESTGVVLGVERDLWNNTRAVEAEGGGPGVRGQPGLYGETQSHPELATFFGTMTELLMETMYGKVHLVS